MVLAQITAALRRLRKLIDGRPADETGDDPLLARFAAARDEEAFAALVRRHGSMVLGVCRRVLGDLHAAEDAFQATFLVLARKAATIRRRDSVGGWLFQVAYRTAVQLRKRRTRWDTIERGAAMTEDSSPPLRGGRPAAERRTTLGQHPRQTDPPTEAGRREVCIIVDEELQELPEKYRTALVLCYLEGQTHEQAARQLGLPLGTLKTWINRGREMLGTQLRRRGVALSATSLAGLLGEQAATATVPATLVQTTTKAAVGFAAGAAAVALSEVGVLAEGVLKTMLLGKVKLAVVLSLALGLCGAGSAMLWKRPVSSSPPAAPQRAEGEEKGAEKTPPRADRHGDPLPPGAIARLGTRRLRHGGTVTFVAFLPGGRGGVTPPLLTAGEDRTIRLWDVATGKEVRRFRPDASRDEPVSKVLRGGPSLVSLSADGKRVAGCQEAKVVHVWDVATGKEIRRVRGLKEFLVDLALAPDGKTLVTYEQNGTFRLWDVATGKEVRAFLTGNDPRRRPVVVSNAGIRFSPDGGTLVSFGEVFGGNGPRHVTRLWDVATGKVRVLVEHPRGRSAPHGHVFSPDGKLLAWVAASGDKVHLANPATGKVLRQFVTDDSQIKDLAFSPDGKELFGKGMPGEAIHVWDMSTGKERRTLDLAGQAGKPFRRDRSARSLAVSPDGKLLAVAAEGNAVRLLDARTGKDRRDIGHGAAVFSLHYSRDGTTVTTQGADGVIRAWETATGKPTGEVRVPEGTRIYLLSPDGKVLVATDADGIARLWDPATGRKRHPLGDGRRDGLRVFAFSPDGRGGVTPPLLAARTWSGTTVRLYDVATGKEVRSLGAAPKGAPEPFTRVSSPLLAFSPDGTRLASVGVDNAVSVWDPHSGRMLRQIVLPEGGRLRGGAFSPDGRTLALNRGSYVTLWEIATGKQRGVFGRPPKVNVKPARPSRPGINAEYFSRNMGSGCRTIAFSPDGRTLAVAPFGSFVWLWDVRTGEEIGQLEGHEGGVEAIVTLAFHPDGKTLATGGVDTTALIWDVARLLKAAPAKNELSPAALNRLWADLQDDDAKKAYQAVISLSAAPTRAVPLLRKRLRPAARPDEKKLARLIADLDSPRFDVRLLARMCLEHLGPVAAPALKQALAGNPSLEARKRIEALLDQAETTLLHGESLRAVRAIEILEKVGTPEARQVLESLAKGAPRAVETDEARAALRRPRR